MERANFFILSGFVPIGEMAEPLALSKERFCLSFPFLLSPIENVYENYSSAGLSHLLKLSIRGGGGSLLDRCRGVARVYQADARLLGVA